MRKKIIDTLIKTLSLVYSVYSPVYPLVAVMLRLLSRRERKKMVAIFIAFVIAAIVVDFLAVLVKNASRHVNIVHDGLAIIYIPIVLFIGTHSLWVYLAKHQYRVDEALVAYPLHERLRPWIARTIGYVPVGKQLVELHIDPALIKQVEKDDMDHVRAGVKVAHAARHLTTSLLALNATASVIGTTYEPRLAETATLAVKKHLHSRIDRPGVCPLGERRLFPNKTWDTFVWELAADVR